MKTFLGIVMILLGSFFALAVTVTIFNQIMMVLYSENTEPGGYVSGYILGSLLGGTAMGWLCYILIRNGIRMTRKKPNLPDSLDKDMINRAS